MSTIERLRKLLAEATPGPLEHREHDGQHAICGASLWVGEPDGMPPTVGDMARVAADFALHAAAVNALPALLDVAEAARAYTEALRRQHDASGDAVLHWSKSAKRITETWATLDAALRRLDEVSRG